MNGMQEEIPSGGEASNKTKNSLQKKKEVLVDTQSELEKWNPENFAKLSEKEQNLFRNAFTTNNTDPHFRQLAELTYTEGKEPRTLKVPKGDLLHQFREDVNNGKLPTVSWLAAPQNFSDHPSAPWYGAWYVSEVLDILTKNPEVWKKTIFIVTYDENDGYFDHVPPFSIPDNNKPGTGKCSAGIETEIEHVRLENELAQGVSRRAAREGAIGLGFRVPMLIASPWSRGGKVCSQVFDHTSSLQFLETFINQKFNKKIRLENISQWRRTISGDLTSAFTPFNGSKLEPIPFLKRDEHVEDIYNAKFKKEPAGYKKQSQKDIDHFTQAPFAAAVEFRQEKGVRPSSALPYELYTHGGLNAGANSFALSLQAGKNVLGSKSVGAPYTVTAPGKYNEKGNTDIGRNWSFAVAAGDALAYEWPLNAFENNQYHLRVYGPNGFYRAFKGSSADAFINISCSYEDKGKKDALSGNVVLKIVNRDASKDYDLVITDLGKTSNNFTRKLAAGKTDTIVLDLASAHHWYDFKVQVKGLPDFEQHYAGRVETGSEGFSDPVMGNV
jgi:phospholipase C